MSSSNWPKRKQQCLETSSLLLSYTSCGWFDAIIDNFPFIIICVSSDSCPLESSTAVSSIYWTKQMKLDLNAWLSCWRRVEACFIWPMYISAWRFVIIAKLEETKEQSAIDTFNGYFERIDALAQNKALLSARSRFMLQDLCDLRRNKYDFS